MKNAAAHSVDPITLSAGLDTFQRHLVTSLARPDREQSRDDDKTQQAVLKAGEDFVISGLQERRKVKLFGRKFIRDGTTIVVPGDTGIGSSENVQGFLEEATGITRIFRIIEVIDGLDALKNNVGAEQRRSTLQRRFHEEEIPHMRITSSSLASTLSRIPTTVPAIATEFTPSQNILLTGAAAILASGGALVEECAKNAACVARAMGYQVWIVAEAGKAVREMDVSTAMDRHTPFQRWNEEPRESQKDASRRLDVLVSLYLFALLEIWHLGQRGSPR